MICRWEKCGIENFLNKKHELITCFSTLSCEVSITLSFYIKIATKSIIMNMSMTCPWCVSWCCFITSLAGVKGTTPFEMCGIAAFETLILASSIRLLIRARKGSRRNNNSNPPWFLDPLSKIRPSDCLNVAF
jgi:hypothetical protein